MRLKRVFFFKKKTLQRIFPSIFKKPACTQQPTRHLICRLRDVVFFTSLCGMFFMLSCRPILWELLGDWCILIASVFREMMGATNELCWSLTYYSLPIWSLKRKMLCKLNYLGHSAESSCLRECFHALKRKHLFFSVIVNLSIIWMLLKTQ